MWVKILTWILGYIETFSIVIFRQDKESISEEEKWRFVTSAFRKKEESIFWWSSKSRTF